MKKRIAIVGFGVEGRAVLEFLKTSPEYHGADIWVLDKTNSLSPPLSVQNIFGDTYLDGLSDFDIVFRSPGVPLLLPQIQNAIKSGVEISSVTDLFLRSFHGTVIGVTGTKGKGTVSTLIYEILKASGRDAYLAGNVGTPAIELVPHLKKESIVVLELSSFQLHELQRSPRYAVVLGIFPDHMDKHKDMEDYVNAKRNVASHQTKTDVVFYVRDNAYAVSIAESSPGTHIPLTPDESMHPPFSREDLQIVGEHNYRNAVIACAVCRHLGVSDTVIRATVCEFKGLPYRIQFVREVSGVRIYNDSASTNPQTTIAGVKSFSEPLILISGGRNKGLDCAPLAAALRESTVRSVVLFGENKEQLKMHIPPHIPCVLADSLREAVSSAISHAQTGDIILFSPGSESLDMFKNYKDRGAQFDEIVKNI